MAISEKSWLVSKEEYYAQHGLDPNRKLLAYACSFVTFSPNYRNVETLARLVAADALAEPSQLLIRLHPNHFQKGSLYEKEAQQIRQLVELSAARPPGRTGGRWAASWAIIQARICPKRPP